MQATDTAAVSQLKGQRVKVTFHDGEFHHGVLQGVTSEQIYFAGEAGGVIRTEISDISPDPLTCSSCHGQANVLHDGKCASCYRDTAYRSPTPREPCVECGAPGIREPGTNKFLCTTHHAEAGHSLRMNHSAGNVLAECFTDDVSSPKHDWAPVRGARFRCIRCQRAEKYDPELLREIRLTRK